MGQTSVKPEQTFLIVCSSSSTFKTLSGRWTLTKIFLKRPNISFEISCRCTQDYKQQLQVWKPEKHLANKIMLSLENRLLCADRALVCKTFDILYIWPETFSYSLLQHNHAIHIHSQMLSTCSPLEHSADPDFCGMLNGGHSTFPQVPLDVVKNMLMRFPFSVVGSSVAKQISKIK